MARPSGYCEKPSRGASVADMRELHKERMKLRKAHRWVRRATHRHPRDQPNPSCWCKSIWPKGKVAKPGRMG